MTLQETQKLLMLIDSLYENWKPKNRQIVSEAWYEVMKPYSYDEIYVSFMRFYENDTKGFAPVPGQLIVPLKEQKAAVTQKEAFLEFERSLFGISETELRTIREERKGIDRSWERKEPENYDDLLRINWEE